MIQCRITRFAAHPRHGTFSSFRFNDEPFCVSLEPYNRDNAPNVSCINTGVYLCIRVEYSPLVGGPTYEIVDVQGRSLVRFHPGNILPDTKACVVLAQHFGKLVGYWAVLNSGKTFSEFMARLDGAYEFMLTIVESY